MTSEVDELFHGDWIQGHLDLAARAEVEADLYEERGHPHHMRAAARVGGVALMYVARHFPMRTEARVPFYRRAALLFRRGRSPKWKQATALADKIERMVASETGSTE